ncbi:hypothetical protein BSCH_02263 [Candidatus Paraburkholderia schumanniana]|nr:hypothetical protein BSCH_02263 [Candidatus Paraburkholderia schumannianae]
MRATLLYTATAAGLFAMSAIAQAQDMQMSPAQSSATQQSAQDGAKADTSYGGATSMSKSGSASRDTWAPGTSQACVIGLSCNIYTSQ